MRRFLATLIILIIAGICPPAKALLLVYSVTCPVKGVDSNEDIAVSIPLKGFLVLDFNDGGIFQDANLFIYGVNSDNKKVYYLLNNSDSASLIDIVVWNKGSRIPYFFVGLGTRGESDPFAFEGCIWGKMTVKDIGFGKDHLWFVPVTLKGTFTVWLEMLLDANQDISGTGNMTASLNKVTYQLNANGWTQDEAVELIVSALQDKDYSTGSIKQSSVMENPFQTSAQSKPALIRVEKKVN